MQLSDLAVSYVKLRRLIEKLRPEVLILSLPQANIIGRIVGQMSNVPCVVSFEHNSSLARAAYVAAYRATSRCVDVVWADCCETLRSVLDGHYRVPPATTQIVPLTTLPPPPTHRSRPHPPRIVSVGRLTHTKNHELAIRAIARLRDRNRPTSLTILGEGRLRAHLERLVDELDLGALVSLPGFRANWFSEETFNAFLLTSRHEGLCIVALEAMWARIPVIGPWIGGLRDYADETTMVKLRDWRIGTVAAAIWQTIHNPELCDGMAERAQARVMAQYGEAATRERYKALNAFVRTAAARS